MEQTKDPIKLAFNALTENEGYLTQESFVKNMKKYKVSLFTGLKPDMEDYDSCCKELFQALLSQCEINLSPKASINLEVNNPFASNELLNDVPDYLRFVGESKENPFGISSEAVPQQMAQALTFEQFR